ncbi:MAG TPA: rubrerythrin family protein [Caldithrix abyssi]|uniref:Rubrerythrin family protein n=1 Tax=Caldithrix abyssi TaxID=187145 RepID=A0A7V4U3R5_CALAY|nr:rubrerythrin family protein [Caldithrix abyssi]
MKKMTEKSLQEAFAGESMAHMKYLAFSDVAEKEGFPQIAKLFKAIAYAEQVHAINHAKALGLIKTTKENIQAGIDGENFEITEMYPAYAAIAKLQEEKAAQRSIHYAVEAEKIHEDLYKLALEEIGKGNDMNVEDVYICPVCGHTHLGKPTERCPICNVPAEKYVKF